ncbi:GAK system CofD-like protein [uncultured Desulfovibrio sp.]|uniref:GAK system CofD-like protein n=1 Tax=uncultured Desulfovibrio sp. TaxID=167968 RepID=UPI00262F2896|nr:GAK system CofD-like protein [uncultured Desulfovibrio sp.]
MMAATPPALGPRLVFFTGGTALREVSRSLTRLTHNSVHLVTPFDSGGSTASLRRAFAMPAVGDIRNRLAALSDRDIIPDAVLELWEQRLPEDGDPEELRRQLLQLGESVHPCWRELPDVFAASMRLYLSFFLRRMPPHFDARYASLGNLMLAGGYLEHRRDFGPVLAFFSRLLQARGVVTPIVEESLHLAAVLDDGSRVVGQHHFGQLGQNIRRLFLTVHEPDRPFHDMTPCRPAITRTAATYLQSAGLICYPMGSFYTSVLANLLPAGVGRAVRSAACPKVFLPNSGQDREVCGLSILGQTRMILDALRADCPDAQPQELLQWVVVDRQHGVYEGGCDTTALADLGLRVLDVDMVRPDMPERHDPDKVARLLCRLSRGEEA